MQRIGPSVVITLIVLGALLSSPRAELLTMVNYESKPDNLLRREGIAILDVDPASPAFGRILVDIPLPPDLVAHHIFFNRDGTKAYITALGKSVLHVMDLTRFPFRLTAVAIPQCQVLEDLVVTADNRTWFLTCMGSDAVIMGDGVTDQVMKVITAPKAAGSPFIHQPHGIHLHDGLGLALVTETVSPRLDNPGNTVTVLEASTGRLLATHEVGPAGSAPVEVLFHERANPPVAYVTNMLGHTLAMGVWDPGRREFSFRVVDDYAKRGQGVPLEMYQNRKGDRLYVTTAMPGHLNVYDLSDPQRPLFLKAIPAAGGAHHVAFSPDERYAFVQNSLIQLPGMNDGSITVIDLGEGKVVRSIDTFKNAGLNPNMIVLLPQR